MSHVDDVFTVFAVPALMDEMAQASGLLYTPKGGQQQTLSAILSEETSEREETADGVQINLVRTATYTTADLTAPQLNAAVQVSGIDYVVAAISDMGAVTELKLTRSAGSEVSRSGYRGR